MHPEDFLPGLLQDRVGFPHESDSPADHPKLEAFTITSPQMLPMPHSIKFQHLKLLQISDSRLRKDNLSLFIRTPENLREFVYRESTSPRTLSESKDPRCVGPQDVFEYLAARNDSLRRVTVIMNKGPKPLTAAVKLTGLEELCINTCAIFNMERMILQSSKVDEFGLVDDLPLALKALHLEILPRGLVCVDTSIAKYVASTYDHENNTQTLERLSISMQAIHCVYEQVSLRLRSVNSEQEATDHL
ncbi:hypothetical protein AK830_g10501 [Neonectria ditissima]|uniref:Uncharacterized protein n=1 Tax=Neonectria ditissima TaxID=78410 RepID=A0A0P7ATE4_9HYPO|nr:hypothetical protein AK830_g10501 [Neonectria ditissima]